MSKELHDLLTEMVKLYQERQCFLSVHAERLCALLPAAPAAPMSEANNPAPVPLTHMQIVELWGHRSDGPTTSEIVSFARHIERAHGIGAASKGEQA